MQSGSRRAALPPGLLALILFFVTSGISPAADPELSALLNQYGAEPTNAQLSEQIGVAYTKTGNLEQAASFFQKTIELDPARTPARRNLATVLWFLGRKKESETMFLNLATRAPDDPVPQLYLGLSAYERGVYEEAASRFTRAGDLASDNPETVPIVVETYLSTGRYKLAREALERLEQTSHSAKLLFELGLACALQGDFESGQQAFLRAHASDGNWPLPVLALGIIDLQTGNAARAADYFSQAQILAPQDYRSYYFRAAALKRLSSNGDAATRAEQLRDLHRAVDLDPSHGNAWAALAELEISEGHDAQGEADLRHALRLEPNDPGALYRLALLYRRQGKSQESERQLRALQELKKKALADENDFASLLLTNRK